MNPKEPTLPPSSEEQAGKKRRTAKARAHAAKASPQRAPRTGKPQRHRSTAGARHGTKTAKILALLGRPNGASLAELRKATGWQAHSVRGFLSGAVKKKMGLRLASGPREDGQRAYRISAQ